MQISTGNSKIGKIMNMSLPPGKTCPGRTEACSKCYAGKAYRAYPSARNAWEGNLESVKSGSWEDDVARELVLREPDLFRIHVSGDFVTRDYVLGWVRIARNNPGVVFLAFTRSWRIPKLREALELLRALPNVRLFASTDEYSQVAPVGWNTANMGPLTNRRARRCPGSAKAGAMTCDECRLCFMSGTNHVWFPIH